MPELRFTELSLQNWRQYKRINIQFGPSMTILTGRNGTGKTSILNLLARHSGYSNEFVATPIMSKNGEKWFSGGFCEWLSIGRKSSPSQQAAQAEIGCLRYSDGTNAKITVPPQVGVNFTPSIVNQQPVPVLNIPSHRQLPVYKPVQQIPTHPINHQTALSSFQSEVWNSFRGSYSQASALVRMKEALISMALLGKGNEIVAPNEASFAVFRDFENRLRKIIPPSIGFQRIRIEMPDILLETNTGSFLIDAASGGLMSIIDLTWEILLFARGNENFVVLFDEPENHLHPSMQRELLPALMDAFPSAQFIVATHSPFIVASVQNAAIYAFDVESEIQTGSLDDASAAQNAVVSVPVNISNRSSAMEILSKVLGVPTTIPLWAERALERITRDMEDEPLSQNMIRKLHDQLKAQGLEALFPEVVAKMAERRDQAN